MYGFKKSKYLVFGGGGLLNPEEYQSLLIWGIQIFMAKLFKLKVILLANSLPNSNSKLLKKLLSKVDFITVRDKVSFDFLNKLELEIPVRQTTDLVFMLDLNSKIEEFEFDSDQFITLNLRKYSNIEEELQIEFFLKLVEEITAKSNLSVYLLPFDKSDVAFLRKLNNLVKDNGRVFLLPFESDVCVTAIKKAKVNVSQRLHPCLFSLKLDKSFIALSYSSKVKSLLLELGYTDNVLDLNEGLSADILAKKVLSLIENPSDLFAMQSQDLTKKAEDNFRLLHIFLEAS